MASELPRSPGSTVAASEVDDHHTVLASSPIRTDTRHSINHLLSESARETPPATKHGDHETPPDDDDGRMANAEATAEAPASSARRRREGQSAQINPMYVGNKLRHLKKDDGEPLWRKDIQYAFLKAIFENDLKVFTNSYEPWDNGVPRRQTFADLYIDTMARSSKTSKILRDKLLTEHEPARNMAMVCLLVNLGRMNTTLNFFPEMRAQLRTYHAIPSLQAHQDPNSYKQLQDAPRLKSILKGASEDRVEPTTLEMIKLQRVPRTNPVNMVFVLSQFAPKITELHMPPDRDFYDLLMKDDISSATRARAFLWLLWFYLESDFTEEGAEENPFGAGVDYDVDVRNQGVPLLRMLNPEEEAAENLDPPEEIEFGKVKQQERKRIIETDQVTLPPEAGSAKRPGKTKANALVDEGIPSPFSVNGRTKDISTPVNNGRSRLKYESDMDVDSTRSTPPPRGTGRGVGGLGTSSRVRSGLKSQGPDTFTPSHAGASDLPAMRRARPLTAHQLAVERHRNERIQHILTRGMRKQYHLVRKVRRQQGAIFRALNRLEKMREPLLASEDEDEFPHENPPFREKGFGGLIPLQSEEEDFGEEVAAYAAAYRRIGRRLERWSGHAGPDAGIPSTATNGHSHSSRTGASAKTRSRRPTDHDMDMDSHGLEDEFTGHDRGSDGDEGDLDDADKTMLGADGEETDDEDGLSQDLRTTVPVEA